MFQITKTYFRSLRPYIFFSSIIFAFSIISGYSTALNYPEEVQKILEEIKKAWTPFQETASLELFLFIALNNISKIALVIALGIFFGIFPMLFLFANGVVVGIVAYNVSETFSWLMFFIGVLPHGVIEIPVLILGVASGMKLGGAVFDKIFRKKSGVKKEFFLALKFFLKILLPLLILAAAVEASLTASLIK